MILSGTPVSAEYANQIGIISELAKPGGALETALSIASELLKNSSSAMMLAKEAIQRCMSACLPACYPLFLCFLFISFYFFFFCGTLEILCQPFLTFTLPKKKTQPTIPPLTSSTSEICTTRRLATRTKLRESRPFWRRDSPIGPVSKNNKRGQLSL